MNPVFFSYYIVMAPYSNFKETPHPSQLENNRQCWGSNPDLDSERSNGPHTCQGARTQAATHSDLLFPRLQLRVLSYEVAQAGGKARKVVIITRLKYILMNSF